MSEELNRTNQTPAPETAPMEAPAPERLTAEDYQSRLEGMGMGSAAKAIEFMEKAMSTAVSDGVTLPSLSVLDPTKKTSFQNFLEKNEFANSRQLLRERVATWIKIIETAEDLEDVHEKASERMDQVSSLLDQNLKNAFDVIRPVERTYRSLQGFFQNAEVEPGAAIDAWLFNCSPEQLLDASDDTLFKDLAERLREEYKAFALRNVYSNLVVAGWPGGVQQIDRLGKLGEMYKVQVFTDTEDYETYGKLSDGMSLYEGLKTSESEKQYVVLAGNHLMSRDRHAFEDDALYTSPASHIAGLVYHLDETMGPHEAPAGYKKGKLQGPIKARFNLDRDKLAKLKEIGVVPAADYDSAVRLMGDWNLSNKEGLDTYARIRTEDWVVKNVCHYLNKQAFQNITDGLLSTIQKDIKGFLAEITGETRPLNTFEIVVRSTPEQRKRHEVDVKMMLGFKQSVHTFNVKVTEDQTGNAQVDVSSE